MPMPILAGMSYRFPPHTIATATRRGRGDNTTLGQKHYNTKRYSSADRKPNPSRTYVYSQFASFPAASIQGL